MSGITLAGDGAAVWVGFGKRMLTRLRLQGQQSGRNYVRQVFFIGPVTITVAYRLVVGRDDSYIAISVAALGDLAQIINVSLLPSHIGYTPAHQAAIDATQAAYDAALATFNAGFAAYWAVVGGDQTAALIAYTGTPEGSALVTALGAAQTARDAAVTAGAGDPVVPGIDPAYTDPAVIDYGIIPPSDALFPDSKFRLAMLINPSFKRQHLPEYPDITKWVDPRGGSLTLMSYQNMRYFKSVDSGTVLVTAPPTTTDATVSDNFRMCWIGNIDNKIVIPADFATYTDPGYPALDASVDFHIFPIAIPLIYSGEDGSSGWTIGTRPPEHSIIGSGANGAAASLVICADSKTLLPSVDYSLVHTTVSGVGENAIPYNRRVWANEYLRSTTPTEIMSTPLPASSGGVTPAVYTSNGAVVVRGLKTYMLFEQHLRNFATAGIHISVSGYTGLVKLIDSDGTVLFSDDVTSVTDFNNPAFAQGLCLGVNDIGYSALYFARFTDGTMKMYMRMASGAILYIDATFVSAFTMFPIKATAHAINVNGVAAVSTVSPIETGDPAGYYWVVQISGAARARLSLGGSAPVDFKPAFNKSAGAWTPDGRFFVAESGPTSGASRRRVFKEDGTLIFDSTGPRPTGSYFFTDYYLVANGEPTTVGSVTTYQYILNATYGATAEFQKSEAITIVGAAVTFGAAADIPRVWAATRIGSSDDTRH